MYGGSSKLGGGRGGAAAGRKNRLRTSYTPPPHRTPASSRLSIGGTGSGPRNRTVATTKSASAPAATEETFSLVRRNEPLAFGMVVKLTADFAEEIKKVGAQGGPMQIKFDGSSNLSGNVIDVGGKEFKFTWFRDNCDIYEEQRNGDDGNGLLVEYGCSWRKLNVHRILDESTKQQYKKRSEEAERMQKARKAIVLDHESPSMKSQIKQLVAVEANPRMHFRNKKEHPFKKHRTEPPPVAVGSTPKSAFKSGPSSKNTAKIRHSTPVPSPPGQSAKPSPGGIANANNSHATSKDLFPSQIMSKDAVSSSEKEFTNKITNAVQETTANKGTVGTKLMDLESMLISLLVQNPKGMSIKALEKAVGDKIPNSAKKIEPIIKKIATLQAPGRYFLRQGLDLESFKKHSPEVRSSPMDNHHFSTGHQDICNEPLQEPSAAIKSPTDEVETHAEVNHNDEDELIDIVDIEQHSPDRPGFKKDSDISEGRGGSSTDSASDSDTDSDSSNSGSDSESPSRSRSKTPAESGSGSSSDSDSDVSSNSKDGSDVDVDVDIIGDDDKGPRHNLKVSESGFSSSPVPWRTDEQPVQNGLADKQDGDESEAVEIENGVPNYENKPSVVPNGDDQHEEKIRCSSPDHEKLQDWRGDAGEDSLKNDQSDSYERTSRGKSKRRDNKQFDAEYNHVKRLRKDSLAQTSISDRRDIQISRSPHSPASDEQSNDLYKGPNYHLSSRADMDSNADVVPITYSQQLGKTSFNQSWSGTENHVESTEHGRKYPVRGFHGHESFPSPKGRGHKDAQYEHSYVNEKNIQRHAKEAIDGGKNIIPFDSHYLEHGQFAGKIEAEKVSNSSSRLSPEENYGNGAVRSTANGRGNIIQKQPSDLEMGEFREPLVDVVPGRKKFTKTSSSKQSDSESNKGKPGGKGTAISGMLSSANKSEVPSNLESGQRWSTPDLHIEDKSRSQHRIMQSHSQPPAKIDQEIGSQFNNLTDAATKSRQGETGVSKRVGPEGCEDVQRRAPINTLKKHERGIINSSIKENRQQSANNGSLKRRESSSDENSSYSRYEKDEPELKGPIKDFSQYEDYVQEYRDKYDSYCSLNKVLESYRDEFQKLGKDLEASKGRDMDRYYNILDQMKESYRRCGTRHKRLKKIFTILHEELKNLKQRIKDFALSYTRD